MKETISIKGMSCKSCAEKIEAKLKHLEGVKEVKVDFVKEKAYVQFDPTKTSLSKIKEAIKSLGYKTDANSEKIESSLRQGIIYGLIPHTCCIAFILVSILGATIFTSFFRQFLLNPHFFYILLMLSFIFATISAVVYLIRQGFISFNKVGNSLEISFTKGVIKRKWKYLATLYSSTIGVNLLFFMVIFPLLANLPYASASDFADNRNVNNIKLSVNIPCPGHAPLITQELKSVEGVLEVRYSFPNVFDVTYDSTKTSKQGILSLKIFNTYPATVLEEALLDQNQQSNSQLNAIVSGCGAGGCLCGCG